MRFTLAWLKEYLEFDSSVDSLCQKLTSIGLEVEEVKNPKNDLNNFIVSEVVEINSHPNADKLKICDVNNGKEILKIVCGASNVKKNMKTVLASVGCIVKPNKEDQFKIKKSKIRGVESQGMLCSEEELNLSEESEGIIELNENAKVGEDFNKYIDDEIIEIEIAITPNRVDCASVFGIARDLSASGFGKLKQKKIKKIENDFESSIKINNTLKSDSCPQFSLRQMMNVKNCQSPEKIIKRFGGSGLKVISALVDVTNYLTVDYCRPLHVFDLDKIEGNITIRNSKRGEKFIGLDEKEYTLDKDMIVICDEKKIISLAGVMGGLNSSCDENTKNILIESAYFMPENVASTGRKLNIISDARYRFERGIDPESTFDGIELSTEMILKICGGKVGSIISDSNSTKSFTEISVEKKFFQKILGHEIEENSICEKLVKLGCQITNLKDKFLIIPPSWRQDLKIKEDLVEEVGRLLGYEKIPNKAFDLKKNNDTSVTSETQKIKRQIKELLVSRNIMEIISWSFSNKKWEENVIGDTDNIEIQNPISEELSCLRQSLLGGLLNIVNKNNNKDRQNISIFEIGPVFTGINPGEQKDCLTIIRSGKAIDKNWTTDNRNYDVFDIKSDLVSLLRLLKIPLDKIKIKNENNNFFHPGKSCSVYFSELKIASFGEIHPNVSKSFKIKNTIIVLEVYISEILENIKKRIQTKNKFFESNFQHSVRDFSFEVDKKLKSIDLVNYIKNIDRDIISDVKVFDNYENENLRAIALEVIIQSDSKTLSENEINELSTKIISQAKTQFNAKLR